MAAAQEAIRALNEAAEALDRLPTSLRRQSLLGGPILSSVRLREEAQWIEAIVTSVQEAT